MKLTVLTYNIQFAGRDGSDDRRARAQVGRINDTYHVIRNVTTHDASDHYPLLASFEVPQ